MSRAGRIRQLPPEVAARIAAGEVIEKPVSVVRELLDNSIDAGAQRIRVKIEEGGLRLIEVTDDGKGIPPDQIEVAFERHATSKIAESGDLQQVATLGFRGEALGAIVAAAEVEIISRTEEETVGVLARLVDRQVVRRNAQAAPVGTTIIVRELFSKVPARRSFLGSAASEGRQITTLVSHYALAYPEIAFRLEAGRHPFTTSGDGNLRHAVATVYGAEQGDAMLDVAHEAGAIKISGLAGPPSLHRGNRTGIALFVNGRWVQSTALRFAVSDAYQSELPGGRYPVASIALRLPPEAVDVNVHPAKAEVRFRDQRGVARVLRQAVLKALEKAAPLEWSLGETPATKESQREGASSSLRERLQPPESGFAQAGLGGAIGRVELGMSEEQQAHRETLPLLRVVGQVATTYVVAEGPNGMYLIDQHAAHERVIFDRLKAKTKAQAVQPLLEPVLVELDRTATAILETHREHLEQVGLTLEPFGDSTCLIRTIPTGFGNGDIASGLRATLEKLGNEQRVVDPFDRTAATVACHSSVRAGMGLSQEEMHQLIEDLALTPFPRTCPHGRPTLVHLRQEAIARQFGR
ncbi:MAG: DNA mismatch repair protein MutL [Dehalococcoidia bacterium]|nr:DNA mismatch repair protein MutL [Dehalococcoidia bacterium]|tara:strand:- start:9029 stop:10768 length:1740 start_codon:yes stop_codon:yes gene_type:complete